MTRDHQVHGVKACIEQPSVSTAAGFCLVLAATWLAAASPVAAQLDTLPYADTTRGTFFGAAVALDEDRALVGAPSEVSCAKNGGAAYIYERTLQSDRWHEVARIVPDDCIEDLFFGRSVALSGDRILVAAAVEYFASARANAVYVFDRSSTGAWHQAARLTVDSAEGEGPLGSSVSLDSNRALITTFGDAATGRFGGAAYVFDRNASTGEWAQAARLTGSGGLAYGVFGGAAALSGDRAIVSSSMYFRNKPGYVYFFERKATGSWEETARVGDIDDFFISLDIDGDRVLVGESREGRMEVGAATVYARDSTGAWHLSTTLKPPVSYERGGFGSQVALSGDRAVVTGFDEQLRLDINVDRVIYVYALDPESQTWSYQSILDIGNVAFGSAIDLDGSVALIGAAAEDETGAAYVARLH